MPAGPGERPAHCASVELLISALRTITFARVAAGLAAAAAGTLLMASAHPVVAAPIPVPSPTLPSLGGGPSPQPSPPAQPTPATAQRSSAGQVPIGPQRSPQTAVAAVAGQPGGPGGADSSPPSAASPPAPIPAKPAVVRLGLPAAVIAGQLAGVAMGLLLVAVAVARLRFLHAERAAQTADPALRHLGEALESARDASPSVALAIVAPEAEGDPAARQAVLALIASTAVEGQAVLERSDGSVAAVAPTSPEELETRLEAARRRALRHGLAFRYRTLDDDGRSPAWRLLRRARPRLG